jgi:regulator of replication initiation timing
VNDEAMANYITDTPSEIAELLELNKQLEQENEKLKEKLKDAESAIEFYADLFVLWGQSE